MDELSLICCAYVCSVLHNHHEHPGGIELPRPLFQTSVKQLCATLEELPTNFASEPENARHQRHPPGLFPGGWRW